MADIWIYEDLEVWIGEGKGLGGERGTHCREGKDECRWLGPEGRKVVKCECGGPAARWLYICHPIPQPLASNYTTRSHTRGSGKFCHQATLSCACVGGNTGRESRSGRSSMRSNKKKRQNTDPCSTFSVISWKEFVQVKYSFDQRRTLRKMNNW